MTDTPRNHALWLAPLIAIAGLLGYFTVATRWPALSDFPWLNLLILAGAVVLAGRGLAEAWRRGGALGRTAGVLSLGFSSLCAALLTYYCFFMSYGLPDAEAALPAGEVLPALTLVDHRSQPVELTGLTRGDAVLVFYRGHW